MGLERGWLLYQEVALCSSKLIEEVSNVETETNLSLKVIAGISEKSAEKFTELAESNKEQVEKHGHFAEQCNKDFIINIAESTSVEVGLFAQTVTTLCLEEGIDVSYTACFPKEMTKWKDIPYVQFDDVKARILLMMSIGKGKVYRKRHNKDRKPDFDKVVNWI